MWVTYNFVILQIIIIAVIISGFIRKPELDDDEEELENFEEEIKAMEKDDVWVKNNILGKNFVS